jgi:hypothetical protein
VQEIERDGRWGEMMRALSLLCAVLLLATTLLLGNSAAGGSQWCEEDPEFLVNGSLVDVSTLFSADPDTVRSVSFELLVPSNATAFAVSLPGTIAPTATISKVLPRYYGTGWMPVIVLVHVSASTSFDTVTTITGTQGRLASAIYGRSNSWTRVQFAMLSVGQFGFAD